MNICLSVTFIERIFLLLCCCDCYIHVFSNILYSCCVYCLPFISPHPLRPLLVTFIPLYCVYCNDNIVSSSNSLLFLLSFILTFNLFIFFCSFCTVIGNVRYFPFGMFSCAIPSSSVCLYGR
jgi:hypothetical protein